MTIVFMGTPRAAVESLERLISDGHDIVAVYAQPDRPSGRGKRVTYSAIKELALSRGLTVLQPQSLRTKDAVDQFSSHNADVAVVVAYGRILPATFLKAFQYGALNVHFSLLPKYRGAAPVNWAIVNGETETGVTIMQMDEGLDTGDILLQSSTLIKAGETSAELIDRLASVGAELLSTALAKIDDLQRRPQDDSEATLAPILKKDDGLIDWRRNSVEIERCVRGFQPFPTAYTFLNGVRITIWRASADKASDQISEPGRVVEAKANSLAIACGDGSILCVLEIQPEGKRRMSVRDFLNGAKIQTGDAFGSYV